MACDVTADQVSIPVSGAGEPSDEALARLASETPGSPEAAGAAATLLGRYQRRVYIWCFRFVREHEQASDLAQDVLLSAYRNLASYRGRAKFFSWIFAIARNRCLNATRRPSLISYEEREPTGDGPDPLEELEAKQDVERLWGLVKARLDPLEQEALYLRCFEHMPVESITTVLKIEESTGARAVLQRARRKLRAALKPSRRGRSEGAGDEE